MKYLFIFFYLFNFISFSQNRISGVVYDSNSKESIIGANVVVYSNQEIVKGTTTNVEGEFNFNLTQGNYVFEISFIGYSNFKTEKIFVNKSFVLDDIFLSESSLFLDDVTVKTKQNLNNETSLITLKNKSINSLDAVSSQSISKSGDGNVASAIKRVSGVSIQDGKYVFVRGLGDRYSKTVLNGLDIPNLDPDKNTVQMDIFPTSVIDNIVVFKSFTPNFPADFSGGLVNITTKSIPDKKTLNFSFSFGFNSATMNDDYLTHEGGKFDFIGFDDGTRNLPLSNPFSGANIPYGIQIYSPGDSNYETIMNNTRSFNSNMGVINSKPIPNLSFSFFGSNYKKFDSGKKIGYYSGVTFKNSNSFTEDYTQNSLEENPDSSILDLDLTREQYGDVGKNSVLLSAISGLVFDTDNSNYKLNILAIRNTIQQSGFFYQRNIESNANYLKKESIDYSEKSILNFFIEGKHLLNKHLNLNWSISPTFSKIADKDVRETAYEMIDIDGVVPLDEIKPDYSNYMIDASNAGVPSRMWRDLDEFNLISKYDISYSHKINSLNAKLIMGSLFSYKNRDFQILRYLLQPVSLSSSDFTGNPNEILTNLLYDGQTGFYASGEFQPSNSFQGSQTNIATYFLEEIEFSTLFKLIAGARLENYTQYYTGQSQTSNETTGEGIYDNDKVLSDLSFFPSLTFIYNLDEKTKIRSSYSLTTARPSFKEKSGAQILDVLSGITFNGNLDLEVTDITNFDTRIDRFFEKNQIISLSAFYKKMKNPIELTRYSSDDDNVQPINTPYGKVFGLEFEIRKALDFIFDGLFVNMNNSLIYSEVEITGDEESSVLNSLRDGEEFSPIRQMQGQAPFILNLSLSYIKDKFDVGLFYNVEGEKLSIVGINRRPNIYSSPFHSINLNFSTYLNNDKSLKLSLLSKNLLNQKREFYAKSYGIEDQIYSSFLSGRTFSFKLSYKLNN